MPRMPDVRCAIALAVLLLAAGCGRATVAKATDEERRLIALMTTDPFIVVGELSRNEKGELVVVTSQGDTTVRYLLAGKPLAIHRIRDEIAISVGEDGTQGTGPEKRGLDR